MPISSPEHAAFSPHRIASFSLAAAYLDFRGIPGVTFTGFDAAADRAYQMWVGHPERDRNWAWASYVTDIRAGDPACFEVAVWSEGILCGLACGKGSNAESYCAVDFIERNPAKPHPLQGRLALVTYAALLGYAAVLGRRELRFVAPNRWLQSCLQQAGLHFTLVKNQGHRQYLTSIIT